MSRIFKVGAVLFEGYELLDFYGPLQMFGLLPEHFHIHQVAAQRGVVLSSAGVSGYAEHEFSEGVAYDLILVPGGYGTRKQAADPVMLKWLREQGESAEIVASVCTGAGILAAAGLLDGYRATTNKACFDWPQQVGPNTQWVKQARWVEDRNRFTAAGVSAGMDMALRLIELLVDTDTAQRAADEAEYEWHRDPNWDPFAKVFGLIE